MKHNGLSLFLLLSILLIPVSSNACIHSKTRDTFSNIYLAKNDGISKDIIGIENLISNSKVYKSESDSKKNKFSFYLLASKKFFEEKKISQGDHFLSLAEKTIKTTSFKDCMRYNKLLHTALKYNRIKFLKQNVLKLNTLYTKNISDMKNFRVILPPMELFLLNSSKPIDKDILIFTEKIIFNLRDQSERAKPNKYCQEKQKLYLEEIHSQLYTNPARIKGIEIIRLSKIYTKFKLKIKLTGAYKEVRKLFDMSLNKTPYGKSFEIYIPKFTKYLCRLKLYDEAIKLAEMIPNTYPFSIPDNLPGDAIEMRRQRIILSKYNKTGIINRINTFSVIINGLIRENQTARAEKLLSSSFKSEDHALQIFNSIYRKNRNIPEKILNTIFHQSPLEIIKKEKRLKYMIPLISYYLSKNSKKGITMAKIFLDKAKKNMTSENIYSLIKLSNIIVKYDKAMHDMANRIIKKYADKIADSKPLETIKISGILLRPPHPGLNIYSYLEYMDDIIEKIHYSKNTDRYHTEIADIYIQSAKNLRRSGYKSRAISCLEAAEKNIVAINDSRLKHSYISYIKGEFKKTSASKKALTDSINLR